MEFCFDTLMTISLINLAGGLLLALVGRRMAEQMVQMLARREIAGLFACEQVVLPMPLVPIGACLEDSLTLSCVSEKPRSMNTFVVTFDAVNAPVAHVSWFQGQEQVLTNRLRNNSMW